MAAGNNVSHHRNADEKYQHASDGENPSCNAAANPYFRTVNLRSRAIFSHGALSSF
jgi:hypothetical protein